MSKHKLSVVRYRYSAAQTLAEILRSELDSSDEESNSDELDVEVESDIDEDAVETAEEVADEIGVNDIDVDDETPAANNDDGDSDTTVDYEPPAAQFAVNETSSPADDDTPDDNDNDDVMWSRCGSIAWRRRCPPPSRHRAHNVLSEQSGLRDGVQFETIDDAFRIFVDDTMVDHILRCTNKHAAEIKTSSSTFRWNELSSSEFYAFLGLNLLAGVQKCRNQRLDELWDEQWGFPVYRATMSLQRFTNILRALRFDDKSTREQRIRDTGNQAAAVQEIFDMFRFKCRSSYSCGPSVTIDEQLVNFHGRCRFRVFMPSKPGKYGLKMWLMADSDTYYCADAQLYAGKVGGLADVGQGKRVVLDLSESISGSGRNITTDNFFTSYALATELMGRRLSLVGTVRSNRKEVPSEMLPNSTREPYSNIFGFSSDSFTLVSYVPKRKKAVILLSTQHEDSSVAADNKNKPEIITYYNGTKCGVDVLDKLVRTYSCKRATRRWTLALFFNLVDIAAYNALVLWITANPDWRPRHSGARRLFLRELGTSLTSSHALERLTRDSGKRRRIQSCARLSGLTTDSGSSLPLQTTQNNGDGRRRRCSACPRHLERKTTRTCHTCGVSICKEHSGVLMTCLQCAEGPGPSTAASLSAEAPNDSDTG